MYYVAYYNLKEVRRLYMLVLCLEAIGSDNLVVDLKALDLEYLLLGSIDTNFLHGLG